MARSAARLTTQWLAAAGAAVCLLAASPAFAVTIIGGSSGTFTNLSSCDNVGSTKDCQITGSVNGANTQVQWRSQSGSNFVNPSKLTAVNVNIGTSTNANDVVIAQLDWLNGATIAQADLGVFKVDWTLKVALTKPSGSTDAAVFSLTVKNLLNPPGDHVAWLSLEDLSNLSFTLDGVTVSDFKYVIKDGPGGTGPVHTTLAIDGDQVDWYNAEGNTASLYITADFTHTGGVAVTQAAPLLLLGASLMGLGAWARRRDRPSSTQLR